MARLKLRLNSSGVKFLNSVDIGLIFRKMDQECKLDDSALKRFSSKAGPDDDALDFDPSAKLAGL